MKDTHELTELRDQLARIYRVASESNDPVVLVRSFNAIVTCYERVILVACDGTGQVSDERRSEMVTTSLRICEQVVESVQPKPPLPENVIKFPEGGKKNDTIH